MDSADALAETSSSSSCPTLGHEPISADLPYMLGSTISAAFQQA